MIDYEIFKLRTVFFVYAAPAEPIAEIDACVDYLGVSVGAVVVHDRAFALHVVIKRLVEKDGAAAQAYEFRYNAHILVPYVRGKADVCLAQRAETERLVPKRRDGGYKRFVNMGIKHFAAFKAFALNAEKSAVACNAARGKRYHIRTVRFYGIHDNVKGSRFKRVVAVHKEHILAVCGIHTGVSCTADTLVLLMHYFCYAGVSAAVFVADLAAAVRAAVINKHDLTAVRQVGVDRIKTCGKIFFHIIRRYYYAESIHKRSSFSLAAVLQYPCGE